MTSLTAVYLIVALALALAVAIIGLAWLTDPKEPS